MRYFRVIAWVAILFITSQAASAQQDTINNFAGGGPNNIPATSAAAPIPTGIALDGSGNLYYATEADNQSRIFKVNLSTGILTVLAGNGIFGYSGDGGPATDASLSLPGGIAIDPQGNLFFADSNNMIVRKVKAGSGIITTVAGVPTQFSFAGDGGPATTAYLNNPYSVAIDRNGNLFIADGGNYRIRMVACATVSSSGGVCTPNPGQTTGDIYTVAGDGTSGYNGDGILASSAELTPSGVATDGAGNLYIADAARVRRVACGTGITGCMPPTGETSGDIYTVAGNGTEGYNGDGIAATAAELFFSDDVVVDNSGNLFISEEDDGRVREVACVAKTSGGGTCSPPPGELTGFIYTVVGTGTQGYNGDNQAATSAYVDSPDGIATDSSGDLYIADTLNFRVREVPCQNRNVACAPPTGDTAGFIYTIAGNGSPVTLYGTNVPANNVELNFPSSAISDSSGNIYIADQANCVIRKVNVDTGLISNFAGTIGTCGYLGDGGPATSAALNQPASIAVGSSNDFYIADAGNCLIRKISDGTITTIAGDHTLGCGFGGDGGAATSAQLSNPIAVALDTSANLYIADEFNNRIRKISGGIISTFAGGGTAGVGDGGPATSAKLSFPTDVAIDSSGNVFIADSDQERIRKVDTLGIINTYAGNGLFGFGKDGVPAREAPLGNPSGVAVDAAGDVLIVDNDFARIRLVDGRGIIHTVAGCGMTCDFIGENVPATTVELFGGRAPGVGLDPTGNIYVVDFQDVQKVDAIAMINSSPATVTFGMQALHTTSPPMAVTLTSTGPVSIGSITTSANFQETNDCPSSPAIGSSCTIQVTFSPISTGVLTGKLTVNYNGFLSATETVNLKGTATNYEVFTPATVKFATQLVNTVSKNTKVTFKYTGTGTLTLNNLTPSANFAVNTTGISSGACNLGGATSLSTNETCAFNVAFSPTSAGAIGGNITASFSGDPGGNTSVQLPLTGTATEVTLSATALAFGTVASGMKNETLTMTNKGATALTFNGKPSISGTGAGQFNVLPNTGGNSTCLSGTPVAQNGTCTFTVQFTSTGGGISYSETMSITDNGGASPQAVKITAKD